MALYTHQIRLGERKHAFRYPKAEEAMILSVLEGRDYPLAKARLSGDSPVIVDIGSNCGASAIYFKSHYPSARVICYEPSASTYELLSANVGTVDGIEIHPCGIWNQEGTHRLHHAPGGHSGASTLQPGDGWSDDLGSENITTKKLSNELGRLQLTSVDLLKVDAESAEPEILHEVLTNAPDVLIQNIFVEYHAIAVRKYLTEELLPKYDVHLCSVSSDRQGTLLFVLKNQAH
ncbi:MAG: FkbM family methyltransferase [Verrucomicrobiota bacterium]|nr:FkbM family methyltransferase [Verrucomicrobiota bacterium]